AVRVGADVQLETPTWRASGDWGDRLGFSAAELRRANRDSVALLDRLRDEVGLESMLVSGCLGPRGDGYSAGDVVDPDSAAAYHTPQIEAFAEAGVDLVTVLTLTGTGEAVGIVRAARAAGLPVAASFTVEQNGRLPDGTPLSEAITTAGDWRSRIVGLRANASARSHEELDAATDLDEGDPIELARAQDALRPRLSSLALIGGCCGTD